METDTHTCVKGPFCAQMGLFLDDSPGSGKHDECEHDSCRALLYQHCQPCESEAMEEADRQYRYYTKWEKPFLDRRLCPKDMTALKYDGHVGAPGYGIDFSCYCGHLWRYANRFWHSEEDLRRYVPELTIADVI